MTAHPPKIRLMPSRSPSAQSAVPGSPISSSTPSPTSTMPLASIQPQRPESALRCSSAYRMVTAPSANRNAINTAVSDSVPSSGQPTSSTPATMPISADTSDHQNPGAWRARKVATSPTMPLSSSSQPKNTVAATEAIMGASSASTPSTTSTIPSVRNSTQWWRTAPPI